MHEIAYIVHYYSVAIIITLSAISVGISEGLASIVAMRAMEIQPCSDKDISKTLLLGMALIETSAIITFVVAFLLLKKISFTQSEFAWIAELGVFFAVGISSAVVGYVSMFPVKEACNSIARQPFFNEKIQLLMLITQSLMQAPIIIAFVISLMILNGITESLTFSGAIRLLSSGLCVGISSIGPGIGLALFSQEACKAIGINRHSYSKVLTFTFVTEAMIESPLILSFIVSLVILQKTSVDYAASCIPALALLFSGLCMSISTCAPSIASGRVAAKACSFIAQIEENSSKISKISFFSQVLIESSVIYGLIISFMIIFAS